MNLIDYKPEHALEIISDGSNEPNLGLCNLTYEQAQKKAEAGPCFTGIHMNRVVGCGGIAIPYPGRGIAWAVYVHDIGNYDIDPQIAKAKFHEMIRDNNIVRCEAPLRTDFEAGVKYAEWLDFEYEATLKKFHPDKTDALMYVIIGG